MNKLELHRTEVENAIYSAILSDELKPFIKIPENYAEDYFEDLAYAIAKEHTIKLFEEE